MSLNANAIVTLNSLKHRRAIFSFLLAACLGLVTAQGMRAWGWPGYITSTISETAAQPQEAPSPAQYEVEVVTIYSHRFIPAELTLPHKKFLLVVNNRAQLETMNLSLFRVNGNQKLKEVAVSRKEHDFNDVIDLPPGDYLLKEASMPSAECKITITNKR
jgi:hypothetical protein